MDKSYIELQRFASARKMRIARQRQAASDVRDAAVTQAPRLSTQQIDALKFRRKFRAEALANNIKAYMARKRKKLPIPDKFSHAKTEAE